MLENDKDLRYTREIAARYGIEDFLIVSFTPKNGELLSDETLSHLKRLRDDLLKLPHVSSVMSILNVPLLESPPAPIEELGRKHSRPRIAGCRPETGPKLRLKTVFFTATFLSARI